MNLIFGGNNNLRKTFYKLGKRVWTSQEGMQILNITAMLPSLNWVRQDFVDFKIT